MKKHIQDYFIRNISYPYNIAHNPIPYGTLYDFVSSTFLNGFINYVKPVAVFQIDRYFPEDGQITLSEKQNLTFTKSEFRQEILKNRIELTHTHLNIFKDDIIILAKIPYDGEETVGHYMYFYYDMDVSDCSIGRFQAFETEEDIIQSIYDWLFDNVEQNELRTIKPNIDPGIVNFTELPLSFLRGWLSF